MGIVIHISLIRKNTPKVMTTLLSHFGEFGAGSERSTNHHVPYRIHVIGYIYPLFHLKNQVNVGKYTIYF